MSERMVEFTYSGFPRWTARPVKHWFDKPWQELSPTRSNKFWDIYVEERL